MSPIQQVWSEAACNREIFSWHLQVFGYHAPHAKRCPVAAKDQLRRFFLGEVVSPAGRAGLPAVLMRLSDALYKISVFFEARAGRVFQIVQVVNLACGMILRHVETVTVYEGGLD